MKEYIKDWTKYTLSIESSRGSLEVKWSNVNDVAQWANMHNGLYLQNQPSSLQLFFEHFKDWNQKFWTQREMQGAFNLPDDAKIIDIGAGTAVVDFLLASYLPESKFWLIDKEGFGFKHGINYAVDYPCYHDWSPVRDAIITTGFDKDRFTLMSPENLWPAEVDCVTSYFSWGWHYPIETYWDKVMSSLRIGGKLILDIRRLPNRDVINEISEKLGSDAVLFPFDNKLPEHVDSLPNPEPDKPLGHRALWIRKI